VTDKIVQHLYNIASCQEKRIQMLMHIYERSLHNSGDISHLANSLILDTSAMNL